MKKILLSLMSFTFLVTAFSQVTGDYRSKISGNWNAATSWERYNGSAWVNAPAAPSSTDGVITILSGHTITNTAAVTVDQVVVNSGGQLTQSSAMTLNNGAGDDLTVAGTLLMNGSIIDGAGILKVSGTMQWNGGGLSAAATMQSSATLNITAGEVILYSTLTNNGTVNWNSGFLSFNAGTIINNKNFNAFGNDQLYNYGSGVFTNSSTGIFTKLTGTGTSTNIVAFTNNGILNINSGTFQNNGSSFINTGSLNLGGGTFLNFSPVSFNAGTSVTGSGTFSQSGNTMTLNVAFNMPSAIAFNFAGGTINGTGSLKITGSMQWNGGSLSVPTTFQNNAVVNLDGGEVIIASPLTNKGTINWNAGYLSFSAATLTNSSLININGDNQMYNYGGGSCTNSAGGMFVKTSTGVTTVNIPLTNNGKISGLGTYSFGTGLLTNKGIFAPGSSIGILTTGTDYTNRTLEIEMLSGAGAGTGHDQLIVNGKAKLKDTLKILRTGIVPKGTYTILTATGSISGAFSTIFAPDGYVVAKAGKNMKVTVPDPGVIINDTSITEGNTGNNKKIKFIVSLAFPSNITTTVDYQTVDSTATIADNDYVAKSGTITFTPGMVSDTITVTVKGDNVIEPDEIFYVKLSNPVNLIIAKENGNCTIYNNDPVPLFAGNTVNSMESNVVADQSIPPFKIPNFLHRNQLWKIPGLADNNIVSIFNSNGFVVFKENNYRNNNNLSNLAAGVYFYQILVHDKNGKATIYKGKLVLMQ